VGLSLTDFSDDPGREVNCCVQLFISPCEGGEVTLRAGSHPKDVHPNAVRVMHARGIDISDRQPKHMDTFSGRPLTT
jgi:hypothetical protein